MTTAPDLEKGPYGSITEAQSPAASAGKVGATPNAVLAEVAGIPTETSEIAVELDNLKERKRKIVNALFNANDFSQCLHRLYRLNIRYHRMSLIKHAAQFYSMDMCSEGGEYQYIQDSDMKALEIDLQRHCK
jgi:uncharacterized protein (DUF2336 family)